MKTRDAVDAVAAHAVACVVRRTRELMHMTQSELADAAATQQPRVAKIETAQAMPGEAVFKSLALALGYTAEGLRAEVDAVLRTMAEIAPACLRAALPDLAGDVDLARVYATVGEVGIAGLATLAFDLRFQARKRELDAAWYPTKTAS